MATKLTSEPLAAQVAHLSADIDCLDRAVVENGVVASRALARTEALEAMIGVALGAAGLDDDSPATSFADPVSSRAQARKRRIERSGLTLVRGGLS